MSNYGMPSDDRAAGPVYGSSEHYGAPAYPPAGQPLAVVPVKTPAIAVLLSFIWLGAGHLYAGRTTEGLVLLGVNLFLILLLMVPLIGWVLSPLAWVGLFIYAAISSSNAVKRHNARFGMPRY
jgi:TM2 domain-containing membrane protein YozV